jgi:predicted TIM-barrel fold metal-dependent hydrolase
MSTIEVSGSDRTRTKEVDVRWVDADVHPLPHPGDGFLGYAPDGWRDRLAPRGHEISGVSARILDQPEANKAPTGKVDSYSPRGGPACSDPQFAAQQLLVETGMDIGILLPMGRDHRNPDYEHALKTTVNNWLADIWLDQHNQHRRWRGSISVTNREPELAAREIERWAGHPMMVQVLMSPQRPAYAFGDPKLDPIYEAAARHRLPVATHLMANLPYENSIKPVGVGGHFSDYISAWGLILASHLMSLVFDGAFDRHPTLKVVFVEGGFLWVLPLMWRMDAIWEARRSELPWVKRRPSEYVRDQVYFTTQPLDDVDTREEIAFTRWLDMAANLIFATDYPHWTYDDPKWALRRLPKELHPRIQHENATELYGLPQTVPALPGA